VHWKQICRLLLTKQSSNSVQVENFPRRLSKIQNSNSSSTQTKQTKNSTSNQTGSSPEAAIKAIDSNSANDCIHFARNMNRGQQGANFPKGSKHPYKEQK
jgi:hypothetical protein